MTNMQHYMEDIQDILEGLNSEMEKRLKRVGKWDQQIAELAVESKKLEEYVFDGSKSQQKRKDKATQLAEVRNRMHVLSEKKVNMCEKSQKTVQAIYKKMSELAYRCKCEVEIDSPGCTEIREQLFCRSVGFAQLEADHADGTIQISAAALTSGALARAGTRTREVSMMTDEGSVSTTRSHTPVPKDGRKRGVGRPRTILKENSQNGKGSSMSSARSSTEREMGKKGDKVSAYMRKKLERIREQQRLEEAERRKKNLMKDARKDVLDGIGGGEFVGWGAGVDDNLAAGDLADEEERELLDLLTTDDALPSPPREIMETLDVDAEMFSMTPWSDSESSMAMPPPQKAAAQHHQVSKVKYSDYDPNASSSSSSSMHRAPKRHQDYDKYADEKRKKNALFATIADTSFSGRPRKLTDRATEMLQTTREREERRKVKKDNDDWCTCDGNVSSQMMVACDNGNCKIEWYHVECVGYDQSKGEFWYCPTCERIPEHLRTAKTSED